MIKILYFASVRETLNCSEEQFELNENTHTIKELKASLAQKGGAWADIFSNTSQLLSSVNQTIAKNDEPIKDGDEVAFFPQVTGG